MSVPLPSRCKYYILRVAITLPIVLWRDVPMAYASLPSLPCSNLSFVPAARLRRDVLRGADRVFSAAAVAWEEGTSCFLTMFLNAMRTVVCSCESAVARERRCGWDRS